MRLDSVTVSVKMQFDAALVQYVGALGRYQIFIAVLLCLVSFPTCLCSMIIIFTSGRMDHWCAVPQPQQGPAANLSHDEWLNLTVPGEYRQGVWHRKQCVRYVLNFTEQDEPSDLFSMNRTTSSCTAYEYDRSVFQSTIVSEWDLVCDRSYIISVSRSIGMAGLVFGGLFGGISDRVGRKLTVIVSLIFTFFVTLGVSLATNLPTFMGLTFLMFCCEAISYITAFTFVMELVGPRWRALMSTLMPELYGVAYMLLAGLGYVFRSWPELYRSAMIIALVIALPMICVMPESPRWLYARKRDAEGLKVLNMMARRNGRPTPFTVDVIVEENKSTEGVRMFFSSPELICRSILIFYAWFVAAFTYYGLTFSLDDLAGSIYVNMVISGALEVVGSLAGQFGVNTVLGRRLCTCGFYVLTGLSLLAIPLMPADQPIFRTVLATFGRFCATGFYTTIYVWTAELYPTVVRNSGMSMSSAVGKIGGVVAPFVRHLADVWPGLPAITFGCTSLVAGLLMFGLPETRGCPLPQTIADMKAITRKKKSTSHIPADTAESKAFLFKEQSQL